MARRRDGKKEAGWRRRLGRWEKSRLKVAQFCEREGVSEASFYYWRKRLDDKGKVEPAGLFVPLNVSNRTVANHIEVELPNRAVVRLPGDCDRQLLCQLVEIAGRLDDQRQLAREDGRC